MKILPFMVFTALALIGCKSPTNAITFTSASGTGVQINPVGIAFGHIKSEAKAVPTLDKAGKPLMVRNSCGEEAPLPVYSSQAGNGDRVFATGQAAVELSRAKVAQAAGPGYDIERAANDCSKSAAAVAQPPAVPDPTGAPSPGAPPGAPAR